MPEYAARKDAPPWSLPDRSRQAAGPFPAPRHPARRRHDHLLHPAQRAGADPASLDGGRFCLPVGQGFLRRRPVRQDRLPRPRHALAGRGMPRPDRRTTASHRSISAGSTSTTRSIYDMICAGDTIGIFQIESRAQIQMLRRTQPRSLEDLIVQVAIVRPGPIIGGAVKPYVDHRHARGPASCPSNRITITSCLEPVLARNPRRHPLPGTGDPGRDGTGRIHRRPGRSAPPRNDPQALPGSDDRALGRSSGRARGAEGRRVPRSPRTVFKQLLGFAEYGFPKAHAAAFAILAYQSCWLKYYYPAEFSARCSTTSRWASTRRTS